jgi:hypothetical protein
MILPKRMESSFVSVDAQYNRLASNINHEECFVLFEKQLLEYYLLVITINFCV